MASGDEGSTTDRKQKQALPDSDGSPQGLSDQPVAFKTPVQDPVPAADVPSLIIKPPRATERETNEASAAERRRQAERRRLALAMLAGGAWATGDAVRQCLRMADELLVQTGGEL